MAETREYALRAYPLYRTHFMRHRRSLVLWKEILLKCARLRRLIYG